MPVICATGLTKRRRTEPHLKITDENNKGVQDLADRSLTEPLLIFNSETHKAPLKM